MLKTVIYLLIVFAIGLTNEPFMLWMRKLSSFRAFSASAGLLTIVLITIPVDTQKHQDKIAMEFILQHHYH